MTVNPIFYIVLLINNFKIKSILFIDITTQLNLRY